MRIGRSEREPDEGIGLLPACFVVAAKEGEIEIETITKAGAQLLGSTIGFVPFSIASAFLPGVVGFVVQFDDVEDVGFGDVAFGESAGAHRVVVLAGAGALRINLELEGIVDESNHAQSWAERAVGVESVDVSKDLRDVRLD